MARVRLTVDVDPDLRRRIKVSAAARDETVRDFIERAILRELRQENGATPSGGEGGGETHSPESGSAAVRVGGEWDDGEDEELYVPPKGSENPPKLERGNTLSEAVIEDRR